MTFESWGKYPKVEHQKERLVTWRHDPHFTEKAGKFLAVGQGRSYGDVCLNEGGILLRTSLLDRIISFDREQGVIRCESGVTLAALLQLIVPAGWFLPVTPGTKFISVGGAVANDIHGKNHHVAGTFGNFVNSFEIVRSDGTRQICSKVENKELFAATIGGLGLTGFITWVEFTLHKINSAFIDGHYLRFKNLDNFFEISERYSPECDFVVSWLDCVSSGSNFGRGIFMGGNFSGTGGLVVRGTKPKVSVPVVAPSFVLSPISVKIFNELYYRKQPSPESFPRVHYNSFFYPLDAISNWNLLYGSTGFFQLQCVVDKETLKKLLMKITIFGEATFLAVLKEFGDIKSPGVLSFPKKGYTLALDFPNRGERTIRFLRELDQFVCDNGGRIYPAKDALMSKESFEKYFPNLSDFSTFVDSRISSNFWRRVQ